MLILPTDCYPHERNRYRSYLITLIIRFNYINMNLTKSLLFVVGLLTINVCAYGADYSDANFNYKYNKTQKFARVESTVKKTATSLTIPSKITVSGVSYPVTQIGDYALSDLHNLKSVTIPSSVTEIREGAFCNCFELQSVKIPSKVTKISPSCFSMCLKLSEVSLPKNLVEIGSGAFMYCESIDIINWPSTLSKIDEYAFYACKLPNFVALPAACVEIGQEAFRSTDVVTFQLPAKVNNIGRKAFADNNSLLGITMPTTVGTMGDMAFFGNVELLYVTLPKSIGRMGESTFERCDKLNQVDWCPSLTTVPNRTFYMCEDLEWITLPDNVTSIGDSAFGECYSLKEFHFPAQLKVIGNNAFDYDNLGEITFPNGLTTIGEAAFFANSRLEMLTIPASVTEIGANAFNNNPHLDVIKVESATPPILGSDGFNQYTYFSALLQVPEQSVMAYKRAAEWCNFQYINDRSSGIELIPADNTFTPDDAEPIELYDLQGRKSSSNRGVLIDPRTRTAKIYKQSRIYK